MACASTLVDGPPAQRVIVQLIRFCGVGAVATCVQYAILIALVRGTGMAAPRASSVGFGISAALNYYLNYRFTFGSRQAHVPAIAKFSCVSGVALVLNYAVMTLAIRGLSAHYLPAQFLATVLVLLWNFAVNRRWTFRPGQAESSRTAMGIPSGPSTFADEDPQTGRETRRRQI